MANRADTERRAELWEAAEQEARRFRLPDNWQDGRGEPTDVYVVDSEKTLDCDDGFSDEIGMTVAEKGDGQFILNVSIAEVATFINKRDTPAMEAYAHDVGATEYLARGNRPMIPRNISENFLSLLPKEHQPTTPVITYSIPILEDGSLGPLTFARRQVRPIRLSYKDVARLRNQPDSAIGKQMARYEEAAQRMLQYRLRNGQSLYDDEDASDPGEVMVREFMVATNTALPLFMMRNGIPRLFRNHHIHERRLHGRTRRVADPAYYWPEPLGHDGQQIPIAYGHDTSPLRRNADRISQANLLAFSDGEPYPYEGAVLKAEADHLWDLQERELARKRRRIRRVGGEAVIQALHTKKQHRHITTSVI